MRVDTVKHFIVDGGNLGEGRLSPDAVRHIRGMVMLGEKPSLSVDTMIFQRPEGCTTTVRFYMVSPEVLAMSRPPYPILVKGHTEGSLRLPPTIGNIPFTPLMGEPYGEMSKGIQYLYSDKVIGVSPFALTIALLIGPKDFAQWQGWRVLHKVTVTNRHDGMEMELSSHAEWMRDLGASLSAYAEALNSLPKELVEVHRLPENRWEACKSEYVTDQSRLMEILGSNLPEAESLGRNMIIDP